MKLQITIAGMVEVNTEKKLVQLITKVFFENVCISKVKTHTQRVVSLR